METEDKRIFKYTIGEKTIFADPFDIDYKIQKASEFEDLGLIDEWLDCLPKKEDGSVDQEKVDIGQLKLFREGCARIVPIIRKAFNIPDFNTETGEGMIGTEVLDLWARYGEWQSGVKKNTE